MTLLMLLALCACGQKSVELDTTALAEDLKALCDENLYQLDGDTASTLYGGVTAEEMVVWSGGGVLADEVAVFRAADDASAETLLQAAQQRIADQQTAYAAYAPDEVSKLDSALVEQHGVYVVVCVSPDSEQARTIVDDYVK